MKQFQRYAIIAVAAFALGFVCQSVLAINLRKSANSRFLSESELTLKVLRSRLAAFRAKEGRFPRGAAEMASKGLIDPAKPPIEAMRRQAHWVSASDGSGGFVYLSATGSIHLNADVSREKFFHADWKRVLDGDLFPKGAIY